MRDHLRQHALEYLAVFIALSGTAYATGTQRANTVGSIDIINGEVKTVDLGADAVVSSKVLDGTIGSADVLDNSLNSVDVRNGQVASIDVANGSLTGADVADNGLTGADLDESSLDLGGPWHEVGAVGEPSFNDTQVCRWKNFDPPNHDTGAFLRDRSGRVHLKGIVDADEPSPPFACNLSSGDDQIIFTLPLGYRPARREVHPVITNAALGRVNVDPNGDVRIDDPTGDNGKAWVSLAGVEFRCAPAGSDGCP
jgi:hypothetical protein